MGLQGKPELELYKPAQMALHLWQGASQGSAEVVALSRSQVSDRKT